MNPFVLDRAECKITAYKGDGEAHGDKEKKCVDLTLTIVGDYTVLALVDRDLIEAVTRLANAEDAAGELFDGAEAARRILRFPKLGTMPWDLECIGREVVVEHGIDAKSEIRLPGCNLNKFKVTVEAGPQVTLSFHLRAFPDAKQSGLLWSKIHEKAIVSVLPPAQKALPIEDGAKPEAAAAPASKAGKKPEAPAAKKGARGKGKLSVVESKPADATPAPDSDRAFPDAIDGTAKPDNWPFPTRPDGDGAGASA